MNDFNNIHALYHSSIAKEEIERRKRNYAVINTDFLQDLPMVVRDVLDRIRWDYGNRSWFVEAWEKYRKMVLDAGLGGKIKMPGAVFNEYFDKYELKELEKTYNADASGAVAAYHSDMYVDDYVRACDKFADEYLAHHGVKGQRWGVRRFQDENGAITVEGKARYGIDENGRMSKEGAALYKQDKKDQRTLDNTGYQNWTQAAGKTALKYLGASGATAVAGFVAEHLALKSGNAKLAAAISAGHTIAQSVITAAGTAHMIVSGVKGAKEKAKILESQKDKMQHSDDELAHHGIKGQKWGIRRFQNEDGTLTDEGKRRYGADSVENLDENSKRIYKLDRKQSVKDAKKEREELSKVYGKSTADLMVKEKYGTITAGDLTKSDKNSQTAKTIAKGAGIAAGVVAGAFAVPYIVAAAFFKD